MKNFLLVEDLTPPTFAFLKLLKEDKRVDRAWTVDGQIKFIAASDTENIICKVRSIYSTIDSLFNKTNPPAPNLSRNNQLKNPAPNPPHLSLHIPSSCGNSEGGLSQHVNPIQQQLTHRVFESILIDVALGRKKFKVGSMYRCISKHPTLQPKDQFNSFNDLLHNISNNKLILGGDFNLDIKFQTCAIIHR
jgi:hypothetical protein